MDHETKKDLSKRVPSASMKNAFQNAKNCIILSLKKPETETKKKKKNGPGLILS